MKESNMSSRLSLLTKGQIMGFFVVLTISFFINRAALAQSVYDLAYEKYVQSSVSGFDELKSFINRIGLGCQSVCRSYQLWDGSSAHTDPMKWFSAERPVAYRFGDEDVGFEEHILFPKPLKVEGNTILQVQGESISSKWETRLSFQGGDGMVYTKAASFGLTRVASDEPALISHTEAYVTHPTNGAQWLGQQCVVLCKTH